MQMKDFPIDKLRDDIACLYARCAAGVLRTDDIVVLPCEWLDVPPESIDDILNKRAVVEPDIAPFRHFGRGDGVILDVGAHWGYTAASMRLAGVSSPIFSFEAIGAHRACLERLRQLDTSYDFFIGALSDKEATVDLWCPVVNGIPITGINSIGGKALTQWHVDVAVRAARAGLPQATDFEAKLGRTTLTSRPLSAILREEVFRFEIDKIAAMKIDVEGHEAEVIRGAREMIVQDRPLLIIEGAKRGGPVFQEVVSLGYLPAKRQGDQLEYCEDRHVANNYYFYHASQVPRLQEIGVISKSRHASQVPRLQEIGVISKSPKQVLDSWAECEGLYKERDELYRQREELYSEREELYRQRAELSSEREELYRQRAELSSEREELYKQREDLYAERNVLHKQREDLHRECLSLRERLRS